jgi:hypothetical protein
MRIEKSARIAGLPALKVRGLIRKIGESYVDVEATADILSLSNPKAHQVLADLRSSGFLVDDIGKYTPTVTGRALGAATAAKPLLAKTAQHLVTGVLTRARLVNEADAFAYCVELIAILGAFRQETPK